MANKLVWFKWLLAKLYRPPTVNYAADTAAAFSFPFLGAFNKVRSDHFRGRESATDVGRLQMRLKLPSQNQGRRV